MRCDRSAAVGPTFVISPFIQRVSSEALRLNDAVIPFSYRFWFCLSFLFHLVASRRGYNRRLLLRSNESLSLRLSLRLSCLSWHEFWESRLFQWRSVGGTWNTVMCLFAYRAWVMRRSNVDDLTREMDFKIDFWLFTSDVYDKVCWLKLIQLAVIIPANLNFTFICELSWFNYNTLEIY